MEVGIMDDYIELGKLCPNCKVDKWVVVDKIKCYVEICPTCGHIKEYMKQDFIDNFQCPDCNCLEGTLEENKNLIAVRCKHCGKQVIVLEKHTTVDHRTKTLEKQQESSISDSTPKCPTCGSTNIKKISSTVKATNTVLFGIFGNKRKKQFHCEACGYEW